MNSGEKAYTVVVDPAVNGVNTLVTTASWSEPNITFRPIWAETEETISAADIPL